MQHKTVAALGCGMAAAAVAAGSVMVAPNVACAFGFVSVISYGLGSCWCTSGSAKVSGFVASLFAMTGTMAAVIASVEGRQAPCRNDAATAGDNGSVQIDNSCSIEQIPVQVVLTAVSVCSFALSAMFSLLASELERRSERRHLMAVVV